MISCVWNILECNDFVVPCKVRDFAPTLVSLSFQTKVNHPPNFMFNGDCCISYRVMGVQNETNRNNIP
jgi:hypothetical protein